MARIKRHKEWWLNFYMNDRFYTISYVADYKNEVIRHLQINYPDFSRCYAYDVENDEMWNVNNDRFIFVKRATMNSAHRIVREILRTKSGMINIDEE